MKLFIQNCDWEITTKCNLKCKHCLINYKPKKELSTEECFLIIDILKNLGCRQINFTGGEALIKRNFLKILEYSSKKGIINNLFTNGVLINERNIDLVKKYVGCIGVSLDGTKKENDFIRGENSYNKSIKSLKLLNTNKIPFGIYLTFNKRNIKNLNEILREIKKFKPSSISLNELVLRGEARKNKKELHIKVNRKFVLEAILGVFPNETFEIEEGCNIDPKNIFLTSEGKFYFCTEIRQCKKRKNLGSLVPFKISNFTKFLEDFSEEALPKTCPYISYVSKKITLNFLTGEKCPFLK